MKAAILFITALLSLNAFSMTFELIGPCDSRPVFKKEILSTRARTVGELTIKTFDTNKIDYVGTERGINTALGTPADLDAMEVISNTEMRSYGWCYSVNGVVPEAFPDQNPITPSIKKITWYYGYAYYVRGKWISQCKPAHTLKPAFLCKKKFR
jgi:hypothetical protein